MRLSLPGILLILASLLFVVPSAAGFYTDWLWFRELGYEGIFLRTVNAQFTVFAATFAIVFSFMYLNVRLASRPLQRPHIVLGTGIDGRPIAVDGRRIGRLALWLSLIIALALGLSGATNWLAWLSAFNAVPFGQRDPVFNRDVGFYVFKLPVFQIIRQQAMVTAVLTLIGCGLYYVLSGSFVIESRHGVAFWPRVRLIPAARRHLGILGAIIFSLMAWGAWLELPRTLLSHSTPTVGFGASYTDVHATFPFLWASLVVLIAGAGLSLWYGFSRLAWPLGAAVGLYFAVTMAGGLYGAVLQRLIVTPNEQDKEQPFIVHNIEATRRAYALDRVEERDISGDAELTPQDIVSNAGTIENVRLWDHQPLLQTFAQIQEIRTYYDFINVDNDRYTIDGKTRQVMLSARELNPESIQNRSWVNERLYFTHGYGLTLGPVNQVTTQGLPVLYIRDLPPISTSKDLRVDQPSIYFGELSNSYVLVRTRQPEFHYPRGDDNETTFYEGTGGVPIGGFLRRLLFAIKFANTDILVTNQLTPESRILFHRRISDRVRLLAPFLTYDSDPYPVVSNGQVFWIQDAYTSTANYPYSTPSPTCPGGPCNYIRNSVKIVIDAFNGTTSLYLAEPEDPLALTMANIFPGMLHALSDMPADLRQHVRYPEDIFDIQSRVFATYHMTNPQVFYNKEDQWQVPVLESERNATAMRPYYTVMRLPGEKRTEFIQMLPFTPRLKDNLSAWMVARSDGASYGRLVVFQFPKQKIVYGPKQIVGLISQDQKISPEITLWNQQGSQVIWGTLLVIPINESLLYVRPLYLRASEGRIPELKRVIVVYQSRIVMGESMNQALVEIFGPMVATGLSPDRLESTATSVIKTVSEEPTTTSAPAPTTPEATMTQLVEEAIAHRDRAEKALRDGNLGLYAEEMRKVGELLEKMRTVKK